jgi:hypothetical protein
MVLRADEAIEVEAMMDGALLAASQSDPVSTGQALGST